MEDPADINQSAIVLDETALPVVDNLEPDVPDAVRSLAEAAVASSSKRTRKTLEEPREPLEDVLLRRVTTIKEGDNVLLRLPSDSVKAVVASKDG
jgi:hypothetical protein